MYHNHIINNIIIITDDEIDTFNIPNSISLELNINNAYDHSSHQKPSSQDLVWTNTVIINFTMQNNYYDSMQYSEVEQPEALYAEIPV